jgi:hypothetical protein
MRMVHTSDGAPFSETRIIHNVKRTHNRGYGILDAPPRQL